MTEEIELDSKFVRIAFRLFRECFPLAEKPIKDEFLRLQTCKEYMGQKQSILLTMSVFGVAKTLGMEFEVPNKKIGGQMLLDITGIIDAALELKVTQEKIEEKSAEALRKLH